MPVAEETTCCCRHDSRSSPPRWPNGSVRRCADGLPGSPHARPHDASPLQMIRRAGLGRGARSSAAANPSSCNAAGCGHSAAWRHGRWAAAHGWLVVVTQVMQFPDQRHSRLFVMQNGIYHFPCSTLSHFGFLLHSDSQTIHLYTEHAISACSHIFLLEPIKHSVVSSRH
jgi:hypothetical protein